MITPIVYFDRKYHGKWFMIREYAVYRTSMMKCCKLVFYPVKIIFVLFARMLRIRDWIIIAITVFLYGGTFRNE